MSSPLSKSSGARGSSIDSSGAVRLRRWLRVLIPLHTSPRRIALGVSIGVLIAFTPSIGFQMGLALVLASILNASRVAAVLCVWITNPLTMGPVFALTYAVGRPFWFTSPDVGLVELSQSVGGSYGFLNFVAVFNGFQNIFGLGSQIVFPMLIGGLIVGAITGGLSYLPVITIASHIQKQRRRRKRSVGRREIQGIERSSRGSVRSVADRGAGNRITVPTRRAA